MGLASAIKCSILEVIHIISAHSSLARTRHMALTTTRGPEGTGQKHLTNSTGDYNEYVFKIIAIRETMSLPSNISYGKLQILKFKVIYTNFDGHKY